MRSRTARGFGVSKILKTLKPCDSLLGNWTPIGPSFISNRRRIVVASCKCGAIAALDFVSNARGQSMNCLQCSLRGRDGEELRSMPHRSCLYSRWYAMKRRCENSSDRSWDNYGGRGIAVCQEWSSSFDVFYRWAIKNGFSPELDLDRRDNSGPYSPENCRWITHTENMNNRRDNRHLTALGITATIAEWTRRPECVVNRNLLERRLELGWEYARAITQPVSK